VGGLLLTIKMGKMMEEITLNGFTYHPPIIENTQLKKLDISHSKPQPAYLYKYYPLSNYSVDALINHYLYAAHVSKLNDEYDCSPYLIDYSKCGLEFYLKKIEELENICGKRTMDKATIEHYYHSPEKWRLERYIANLDTYFLYKFFGIISLSSAENDILMWTHYAKNSGFMIKINPSLVSHENLYGPFPINYCSHLHKIDYNLNPIDSVLYQSNIKKESWSYEKEWRYLYNPNPQDLNNKTNNRLDYDKNALVEIVLGYRFLEQCSIQREIGFDILNLKKKQKKRKLKRKLLNFIVESGVKTSLISADIRDYNLIADKVYIENIGPNIFKINYTAPPIES
jgi:hypothetical protein